MWSKAAYMLAAIRIASKLIEAAHDKLVCTVVRARSTLRNGVRECGHSEQSCGHVLQSVSKLSTP